ncbi:MAG: DNA polymerase III subunit gamma/tau [Candidatus Omnitrophica bacterium]|nr:DNA polymerase III subunit gamma/tau [Candidatus Omnitrophota bacterium]MBU4303861.1 DNA polymerase III subunit gamma/tau [Candidatus Omnitrophota bacterium]MBU4419044.1 DNA polymerase III subunit gamma/tau [Candidatus Omnitrophota bacterium]MBU4467586.1 DNA polymerase III subunit gamma/tau [Candidatus Omnitrophota bacterium]MCG2708132.1 DNA polymerase III subunit gamma/tau [Candidatus Omnitrophota bacterium]
MAYTVFALKWRPQDFESIIGQDHIVGTLKNAIGKDRLAHAYLFAGPRGVGKTSTARILAKALNCKEGPTLKPCQKCSSCLEINQGRSLDVIEIDGASNRGIDEIRALRENVKFSPTQGKYKIYIIDEVHQITPDGFNALLKTLEEPPAFVKFIFATTHPQKVMPTIISRCQRMDFRRITVIEIIAQLERIVRQENIVVDKEVLAAVARSSDGSLRDAESVLDQLVSFSKENISLKDAISVLGMVEQDVLFALTDKIVQKDPGAALKLFNEIIDDGKDPGVFLVNLIEHFRNLMVAKVSQGDAKLVDLPQEICDRLFKQSQSMSLEEIFTAFNILIATQEMTKRLDSQRIPLEISLVRLAHNRLEPAGKAGLPAKQGLAAESKAQPNLSSAVNPKTTNLPSEKKEQPGQIVSVSLENVKDAWSGIVNNLSKIKMSVSTYLSEGEPTKVQGEMITVAFPKSCSLHKESLDIKENKAIVEKVVSELCNADLRVNFILVAQMQQNTDARSNPFIKSALEMFGGRVVKEN